MNALRIRVVKLKPDYGVGEDFIYAIQLSESSLLWYTVSRHKEFDQCLFAARALEKFIKDSMIVKDDKVLWSSKL